MKKIYSLLLLLCVGLVSFAQVTRTIWAGGASSYGSTYTTGSAFFTSPSTYVRNDNTIAVTNPPTTSLQKQAGYAVFKLDSIPNTPGTVISSVTIGVCVVGYTASTFGICYTYGYPLNLATITTPSTLYNYCSGATGAGRVSLFTSTTSITSTGSYGSGVGIVTMTDVTGSALCNFIGANAGVGNKISICFSGGGSYVYNFRGETGASATSGLDAAPFIQVTYCSQPTGVVGTIAPNPVCSGNTYTLTGTATGASSYRWYGPGGYTAFTPTVTNTASAGLAGPYIFTAYTSCGTYLDSVRYSVGSLTVNSAPAPIGAAATTVCSGNTIYLSDITAGGVWSSSNTLMATVSTTGTVVAGAVAGNPVISYKLGTCAANITITVNNPPTAITGPVQVCELGGSITLSDGVGGGIWSTTTSSLATIDPSTGVVSGTTTGASVISYTTGACPPVGYSLTVQPLPTAILGGSVVCVNATLPLSDATALGTWTTSNTTIATANSASGVITGVGAGSATVTYTLPTGCYITEALTVNPIPSSIIGPSSVCVLQTIALSDMTAGGTWSSSSTPNATVVVGTGVTTGVAAGSSNISYILPVTGCYIIHPVLVNPLPSAIVGNNQVCVAAVVTLSDNIPVGTWSSQLTTIATVDPNTGDVTGVAGGVSRITYTLSATGCFVSYPVTVNPLPTAVITPGGPTTFCASGSVTLNATTGVGYVYQWISNGTPIPGANAASYVSNSTELITLQVTDGNNCVNTSTGEQITLIPSVAIIAGGPTTFCQTGNVLLSVPLAPGILYQWKLNGVNIPTGTTHTYYATLDGIYTCDLVVPGGCSSTTPPFTVTVHSLPHPIVFYSGTVLTTANTFLTYKWFINSVAISGATTNSVTPTTNGSYRVEVTDGNGCTNYSDAFIINDLAVGQVNKTDVSIYPNPANTVIHILSTVTVRAEISTMDGKMIMEQDDAKDMDISKLPDGLYMISLFDKNGDKLKVQKLIKE